MAVNVIAFAYSGFQAYDLVYQLTSGKCKGKQHLRYYFDFSMDQVSPCFVCIRVFWFYY